MSAGTPVEVWGPAFAWLTELTVEATITTPASWSPTPVARCRLCELEVPLGIRAREAHVKAHVRERAAWVKGRASARLREQKQTLREVNRERRLTASVLNGRTSEAAPASEQPNELAAKLELELAGYLND